jgi:hypothetical protein
MERETIRELIEAKVFEENGRCKLRCADAFVIGREHGVDLREITAVCNADNIRICRCQLGCFE